MKVKVAVLGTGSLGKEHARIYSELAAAGVVEFTGVFDVVAETARKFSEKFGVRAFASVAEAAAASDALNIVTPTTTHYDLAQTLLSSGKHLLVEKPMTATAAEAAELVRLAQQHRCVLQVGHVERFNPVFNYLQTVATDPRFIEVHRLGTFPERSLDIDVVFDLMIHDLDVVLSLVNSDVESLEAVGVPVVTSRVDIANARLRFANGCIANLTASRISRDRVRKIRFFQHAAYLSIDYAAQKVEVWRLVQGRRPTPSIEGGEIEVAGEEPLKRELADFVDAVVSRRAPKVTGEAGRRALALAQTIVDKMAGDEMQPRQHETHAATKDTKNRGHETHDI